MSVPPTNYVVKRITFNGKKVPVALQNVNGPCPLLAVANILALRGHFSIHEDKAVVTADELLAAVSDHLFDANAVSNADYQRNYEKNVSDVIQMLPKTLIGIDVNLKFDSITSFEFTTESMIFDFCNVRLVHGWLVDPQDVNFAPLSKISYNQLVEKEIFILDPITPKLGSLSLGSPKQTTTTNPTTPPVLDVNHTTTSTSETDQTTSSISDANQTTTSTAPDANQTTTSVDASQTTASIDASQSDASQTTTSTNETTTTTEEKTEKDALRKKQEEEKNNRITQALLAERFLNETATQLTYHGLTELHTGLKEEELCVFFRNNHFNTLYKHNGELFLLVTDQGYASTPVVWEKLCQIDGDSMFLKHDFTTYLPTSPELALDRQNPIQSQDEDMDLALAIQLQDEENQKSNNTKPHKSPRKQQQNTHDTTQQYEAHESKPKKEKEHCILQ